MRDGWEIKKLGDACILTMGQSPESSTYNEAGNGMPFFQGCADFGVIHPTITTFCSAPKKIAEVDDVLMSVRAPIGTLNVANVQCCIGRGLASIRQKPGITIYKYLYYFISKSKKRLQDLGTGATFKAIGKETLVSFPIPVPPVQEQEKIVAELDCLSGIIEKKKQQLKELDNLAQSVFYDMFGDPIANEKGWDVEQLGSLSTIVRGGSPRPIEKFLGGTIPWIKIGDATDDNSMFINATKEHIIEEGLKKTRYIPAGSLIFANCGVSLGFARIITFDGCIHDGWLAIQDISEKIDPIFLLRTINFCTKYFRDIAPGGTQPNLNTGIMKSFKQIVPPRSTQTLFAHKIEAIEEQKKLIKKSIQETETLFNSRMDYWFN